MNLIVAVEQNWGIGCDGKLLTYLPDDLKFFREKTTDKVVVMGHSTLKSLPNSAPLKDRVNIVLSRNQNLSIDNAVVCNSLDMLTEILKAYESDDVFVIGGQDIYKLLLPYCSKAYITKILKKLESDKFFPNIDELEQWSICYRSDIQTYKNTDYVFTTYQNSNPITE